MFCADHHSAVTAHISFYTSDKSYVCARLFGVLIVFVFKPVFLFFSFFCCLLFFLFLLLFFSLKKENKVEWCNGRRDLGGAGELKECDPNKLYGKKALNIFKCSDVLQNII